MADQQQASMDAGRGTDESNHGGPRHVYSPALFRGDREIVIIHQDQKYRLRITRANKLILTK
jgi:hemin uptake protein HemP